MSVHTVPQALKLSPLWQPQRNSSGTSSSSFCDGHGRCICVRACAYYVSYGNEHIIISREGLVQGRREGGRVIQNPHVLPRGVKSKGYNDSSGTTAAQQHQRFKVGPLSQPVILGSHVCTVFTRRYLYMHSIMITHLFPRAILNQTHAVEPHPAIQQYTRYTAVLGVNR